MSEDQKVRVHVRITEELHEKLRKISYEKRKSINDLITQCIEKGLGQGVI